MQRRKILEVDRLYNEAIAEFSRKPPYTPNSKPQFNSAAERKPRKLDLGAVVAWGITLTAISGCGYFIYNTLKDYLSR